MSKKFKLDFLKSIEGKPFYVMIDDGTYNEPKQASGDPRGSYYYVSEIKDDQVEVLWNVGFRLKKTDYSVDDVYRYFMEGDWVLVEQDLGNLFQDLH